MPTPVRRPINPMFLQFLSRLQIRRQGHHIPHLIRPPSRLGGRVEDIAKSLNIPNIYQMMRLPLIILQRLSHRWVGRPRRIARPSRVTAQTARQPVIPTLFMDHRPLRLRIRPGSICGSGGIGTEPGCGGGYSVPSQMQGAKISVCHGVGGMS
jgi:hypothetical protein